MTEPRREMRVLPREGGGRRAAPVRQAVRLATGLREGRLLKIAILLPLSVALAGRQGDLSALFMPMEPTPASIAAPRRSLTDAEKEAISAAVTRRLGGAYPYAFRWLPLVVRPHGHRIDVCGLVSGDFLVGEYDIRDADSNFRAYYAQLAFDRGGKLAAVDVVSIGRTKRDAIPTATDSICMQNGYNVRE